MLIVFMKSRITYLLGLLLVVASLHAQNNTVAFNYERNWFNENSPVPSECYWVLTGDIPRDVQRIELSVFKSSTVEGKKAMYRNFWRKGLGNNNSMFVLPVNLKLKENSRYSYTISYYNNVSNVEREELRLLVSDVVENYLRSNIAIGKKRFEMKKNAEDIYEDLNLIIADGLAYYRSGNGVEMPSFSTIILEKLEQIESIRTKDAKYNVLNIGQENSKESLGIVYLNRVLSELITACDSEVDNVLNRDLLKLADEKVILNYPTENKPTSFRLNVGYAGIYNSGKLSEMSYATAPYIGMSIPLGNSEMNDNFLSRSAISFGLFLTKFTFSGEQNEVNGFLIKLPPYVAYGIKPTSFLRLNIGATAFEKNSIADFNMKNISVRPFVGIALELDVLLRFMK